MDASMYLQSLVTAAGVIMGVWGFVKVVRDIKSSNDSEVMWRDKVNRTVKIVDEKAEKWDKGLSDVYAERETIVTRFDLKLKQIKDNVDVNHAETEGKIQELTSMMIILLKSVNAMLDREIKEGANGDVKKMHEELTNFLYDEIGK